MVLHMPPIGDLRRLHFRSALFKRLIEVPEPGIGFGHHLLLLPVDR
jgi:hypothetical protein